MKFALVILAIILLNNIGAYRKLRASLIAKNVQFTYQLVDLYTLAIILPLYCAGFITLFHKTSLSDRMYPLAITLIIGSIINAICGVVFCRMLILTGELNDKIYHPALYLFSKLLFPTLGLILVFWIKK